jgi:hypothetical protein
MRLGPRRICCCTGLRGTICWADYLNHALLHQRFNHHLCDRHDRAIQDDYIVTKFWTA